MLGRLERLMPRMRLGVAALVGAGAFGAVAVQGASAAAPVESVSTSSLPTNYASGYNWRLHSSACDSASCVTVGYYEYIAGGAQHGLIVPITNGVGGPGIQAPLPGGADQTNNQNDVLAAVACWSTASCVAVGGYVDSNGHSQGMVIPITNGIPGTPQEIAAPGSSATNPAAANPSTQLLAVSCTSAGACVAVGYYATATGGYDALYLPINAGVAAPEASEVAEPSSSASPTHAFDELSDVSCQSSGLCVAVGDYYYDDNYDDAAMLVPITNGAAGATQTLTHLPSDFVSGGGTYLSYVSCPATGTCSAVGSYNFNSAGQERNLVIPITGGIAGAATEALPPAGVSPSKPYEIDFTGIACQATGACVAAGNSEGTSVASIPVALPISNGVPSAAAVSPALPSDADATQNAELNAVSCPDVGPCLAGGDYQNVVSGNTTGMTVSFDADGIGPAVETQGPTGNDEALFDTVGCAELSCALTGESDIGGTATPYVLSAQAPLTIAPTSLPAGKVGTSYSQALSVSGAWGTYGTWSVASGALPAGVSLNAQTGVISGTPTASGTSTFTVQVSAATGTPLQTATQSYSVTIASAATPPVPTPTSTPTPTPTPAAATPMLTLLSHSATVSKKEFGVKLSCSAAACHGSLKLKISETVTVKHGKKKVRKHITVAIGNAGFSLATGESKWVSVTLNAIGRRALAVHHRLSVTVLDTLNGTKGTLGHVTLTAAPIKHKKH
jgi:hypothetical protein